MSKTDKDSRVGPCNCLALRQAARHVSQLYDGFLAEEGLRTTQYSVLAKLDRLGPLSINALAATMVMDRTTLGRAIRPLERDKLLEIAPTEDGRRRSVGLTAAGRAKLRRAKGRWRQAQDAFEAQFGVSEAAQLRQVLLDVVDRVGVE